MSGGMTAGAFTLAALGAGAATAGTAYSIVQGKSSSDMQAKGLRDQELAQSTAKAASLSQARKSEVAQNQANMKTPDIAAILSRAAESAKGGVGSTMLTGPGGVNPAGLNLGGKTLLGG
jgi:hypothetical protein